MATRTVEVPAEILNEARRAAGKEPLDATGTVTLEIQDNQPTNPAAPGAPAPSTTSRFPKARTLASTVLTYSAVGAGVALGSFLVSYFSGNNGVKETGARLRGNPSITDEITGQLKRCEVSARKLNQGSCMDVAQKVVRRVQGARLMGDERLLPPGESLPTGRSVSGVGHLWVTDGEKYYDAERPKGVDDWRELPSVNR